MEIIRADEAPLARDNDSVLVREYDFASPLLNDAYITFSDRYPTEGYIANRVCTALVSIESGEGSITVKDKPTTPLAIGDRLLIQPGEPYYFLPVGELVIRYISTPAWRADQTFAVE